MMGQQPYLAGWSDEQVLREAADWRDYAPGEAPLEGGALNAYLRGSAIVETFRLTLLKAEEHILESRRRCEHLIWPIESDGRVYLRVIHESK